MKHLREASVAAVYGALLLVLWLVRPEFYTSGQFWKTLVYAAPLLVAAIGMTLVIVAREIDISIGWQLSACAIVAAVLAKHGYPLPVAIAASIATGAALGTLNGVLVAGLGLPSIVVTLATMAILRESLRWLRGGEAVRNLFDNFEWFGCSQIDGERLIVGAAFCLLILFLLAMRYLMAGRMIYAVGSDAESARLVGIRPKRVVFNVFVLMGALVGVAAVLKAVQDATVEPVLGRDVEFVVIAAVVVGGTSITGGRGNLIGTLLGVLLLSTIGSAFVFLEVNVAWEKALQGAVILAAVASDAVGRRRR
jgi:rhamnose transport system permease protein